MGSPILWGGNNTSKSLQNKLLLGNGSLIASDGAKNYIVNPGLELGTTSGWSLFNTTLSGVYPTGSISAGATSITTFGVVNSGQLAGAYSLDIAASSAFTAGQGFISDAFTIDSEDKAKVMTIQAYYQVISGLSNLNLSGTSSNTFALWVYDVTNSAWIMPAGSYGMTQGTGAGYVTATFQTSATGTQYRLAIICVNTSAGAAELYFDDMFLGPETSPIGAVVTNWQQYTMSITANGGNPTVGGGTLVNKASWRRVGDSMEIMYTLRQTTAGSGGTGDYQFSIPSGAVIDLTALGISPNGSGGPSPYGAVGYANISDNNNGGGVVIPYTSTTLGIWINVNNGSTNNFVGSGLQSLGNAAFELTFFAKFPVVGWSSNVQLSSDTDTRVVAMSAVTTAGLSPGANTDIKYEVTLSDTHGGYNSTTGKYTVPVSGYYDVGLLAEISTGTEAFTLVIDGTQTYYFQSVAAGLQYSATIQAVKLNAGQTISIQKSGTATLSGGTPYQNGFSVVRVSGPSVVAASEKVYMQYTNNSADSITANTTNIDWTTKVVDSHDAWNGRVFTAPKPGMYHVEGKIIMSSSSFPLISIYKNGSSNIAVGAGASSTSTSVTFFGSIYLLAGETLSIRTDTTFTVVDSTPNFWITITSQG